MCFAMFHDVVLIKKKKVIAAICASGTLNLGKAARWEGDSCSCNDTFLKLVGELCVCIAGV